MDISTELMARQQMLEEEMVTLGIARYRASVEAAQKSGEESTTSYGQFILKNTLDPIADGVRALLAEDAHTRGPTSPALKFLDMIDADVAAALTLREIINSISGVAKLTKVASNVGHAIEDEVRFRKFKNDASGLFAVIKRDVEKRTSSKDWLRKVLIHSMNKAEVEWEAWPVRTKVILGKKLIGIVVEATGMVDITRRRVNRRAKWAYHLTPTEDTMNLIMDRNALAELRTPSFMPTIVPPRPWTGPWQGGYYFATHRAPLVKTPNKNYLEELRACWDDLEEVVEATNVMQRTPWKINTKVLDVMSQVWDLNLPIGGLPDREEEPLPTRPKNIGTNEKARREWKRKAARVHANRVRIRSKRMQQFRVLELAEKFQHEKAIYFPHNLDFRGRAYCLPTFLTPQGADPAKALLTFAEGKPINDEVAVRWLFIHGANVYGEDKIGYVERYEWVVAHHEQIVDAAADPLANKFWTEATEPWQFLAFCQEYTALCTEGYGYVSHLPCAMDGTANGLQHFSAMLRDEVGASATNMLPDLPPSDIYQVIADRVTAKLDDVTANGHDLSGWISDDDATPKWAGKWLAFGVDRKLTKRPVMVLPYGGTKHSCRAYIEEAMRERCAEANEPIPFEEDDVMKATSFLADVLWDAINETVVAARTAMDWLRDVTKLVSKTGLQMLWYTPDGFPVHQTYFRQKSTQLKTVVAGVIMRLRINEDLPDIDIRRQMNGVSPNFVHSLDATAMRRYVLLAKHNGVQSFALVHDSFGTLAADTEISQSCLRHAFVDLYVDSDPIKEIRDTILDQLPDLELPPLPPRGTFDVELTRNAPYFFA